MSGIAIVGMACRYPGARSPMELWENVLAQRRAFRRIPPERLSTADYFGDRQAPDRAYAIEAAVLEDWAFDRLRFRVAGSTFRAADLTHWLALDVATAALADAGFGEGEGLPRDTTGVILGNTLTGEFSRAGILRLRWPYVRRVVDQALRASEWPIDRRREFLDRLEGDYKAPFPPVGEETLAGSLSNTIAGRVCNHFDLKGGGYTVDAACAASLLAVCTACGSLETGDLDVALAGGVDLSLDPFELVGFAKTDALARGEMRVYDAASSGFWPGEGCGIVVLMREADAVARGHRIYAVIRGWGVSSDGRGGITRPEADGQLLAVRRAYRRAGFEAATVGYFEGHGTGTAVGDATELAVLRQALAGAIDPSAPAALGSIKANIGHTKAAAGAAGLIKATLALYSQTVPPTTGCLEPHAELTSADAPLAVPSEPRPWPAARPLRAGVSAMGFGGINTHLAIEGAAETRRTSFTPEEVRLAASPQDAELFLFCGRHGEELAKQIAAVLAIAPQISRAEMADLAAALSHRVDGGPARAAVVASSPASLAERLESVASWLREAATVRLDPRAGTFLATATRRARLGFLFPGQGSPANLTGGVWPRRFAEARAIHEAATWPDDADERATEVAQPAIVGASLVGLDVLARLGIAADVAIGHSLGELTALCWAGALSADAVVRVARVRGRAMASVPAPRGAMASVAAGVTDVEELIAGEPLVIAALNGPRRTVVSGEASAVARLLARARARGIAADALPVSHAFHSPLVAPAEPVLAEQLAREELSPLRGTVISTVLGRRLTGGDDLRAVVTRQVTAPVRWTEAVAAAGDVDLFLEVGPGHALTTLVGESSTAAAIALDAGGRSLSGLLCGVGAAFALGADVQATALFSDRFTRPFDLDRRPRFLANPCELAPASDLASEFVESPPAPAPAIAVTGGSTLEIVTELVAARAELPANRVHPGDRLLGDLHLNSITVSLLVADTCRAIGIPVPISGTQYADATVADLARTLDDLARTGSTGGSAPIEREAAGIAAWTRAWEISFEGRALPAPSEPHGGSGCLLVVAAPAHPLREPLERAAREWRGNDTVIVCLPADATEDVIPLLLDTARDMTASRTPTGFVLVQHGRGAAAFAKTLHLEAPWVTVAVVDVPFDHPDAAHWVVAEASAARGFVQARYDADGRRSEPALRLLAWPVADPEPLLGPRDVLLVTGGGKGITAECALAMARDTGVRLALVGRSRPEDDPELAANLARMTAAGVTAEYVRADVTDAAGVQDAVRRIETSLGPITALYHGAGRNEPRLIEELEVAHVLDTVRPKVDGARNVLGALDGSRLRLLVTFGSVIARSGLRGEADYGLANEWLTDLTERFRAAHPGCRCLTVEWSVWAGAGMGVRLGRLEALARDGITAIPLDEGVAILQQLAARPVTGPVVVTGRFGGAPTLPVSRGELPFRRFLERIRVHYPGVELIVDADASVDTDPYVEDHVLGGERLFPAVMGLEAMAQVAQALVGAAELPRFEDVAFDRPVVVPPAGATRIRLAALAHDATRVEVALRSESTGFQVDHFRATCRFGEAAALQASPDLPAGLVAVDPARDLYGPLLFHRGRFRRVTGYRQLRATECAAELSADGALPWFGRYLPDALALGDPGARDACVHAVQACIPHARLLPIGVQQITMSADALAGPRIVRAVERAHTGETFVYDLDVRTADGRPCERWDGLSLRVIEPVSPAAWPLPLLGVWIERRARELLPSRTLAVWLGPGVGERPLRSDRAIRQAAGEDIGVDRRADGKPELRGRPGMHVSAAHAGDLTLAVAHDRPVGCDVELVAPRSTREWQDLLGHERYALAGQIAGRTGEGLDAAATRVWCTIESMYKAGGPPEAPLTLLYATGDGWVVIGGGGWTAVSGVAVVSGGPGPLAVAVLARSEAGCEPTSIGTSSPSRKRTSSATSIT
jgi:enediyne polyketide synthase